MAEEETKPQPAEKSAAAGEALPPSTAESDVDAPLTRKRTRDDFEADNKEEAEREERKIAPLKRRKSVTSESKDEAAIEKLKKADTIAEASKEGTAEAEEPEKETAEEVEEEKNEEKTENDRTRPSGEVEPEETETKKDDHKDDTEKTDTAESKNTTEDKSSTTTPRFVFGATTPFGANAFSMTKRGNVFDSASSNPGASTKSVFGSGSSFGNAFQSAITKKSIFDDGKPSSESPAPEGEQTGLEPSKNMHMYKQVDLEKKDIKSGEEDEEQVFTCRAKLYALDLTNVKDGWRERGVGNIHVNKSKEAGKSSRIIMRSNGLLKVILNTPLVQGLEVVKGMPSSMNPEKFIRITSMEDSKPVQYAIKTGNVETTETMFITITDLIPKEV